MWRMAATLDSTDYRTFPSEQKVLLAGGARLEPVELNPQTASDGSLNVQLSHRENSDVIYVRTVFS